MCNTNNPFKVGDKVKVKRCFAEKYSRIFNLYAAVEYAKVIAIHGSYIVTDIDKQNPIDYIHFELYKEPTQEKQPMKTKRIPFSEEAYAKYKGVARVWFNGKECNEFVYLTNGKSGHAKQGYALYKTAIWCDVGWYSVWAFELEIPVTTKRIPFDASRKNAKVLYFNYDVVEWVAMQGGAFLAITYKTELDTTISLIVNPDDLTMEIEE